MTKILPFLLAALLPLSLHATGHAIAITRIEASELYLALTATDAGLAPANAIAAADNINALRPLVEALDKGKVAYQRSVQKLSKSAPADINEQVEKLNSELQAKADESVTVTLTPLVLTDDELAATKIKPATLATIRRWLLPSPTPPPK